jgi:hypothetical protein
MERLVYFRKRLIFDGEELLAPSWKPERKRSLGRPRRRWVDNIEMDLKVIG